MKTFDHRNGKEYNLIETNCGEESCDLCILQYSEDCIYKSELYKNGESCMKLVGNSFFHSEKTKRVEKGGKYYSLYIEAEMTVVCFQEWNDRGDDKRYKNNNYFLTRECAEKKLEAVKRALIIGEG